MTRSLPDRMGPRFKRVLELTLAAGCLAVSGCATTGTPAGVPDQSVQSNVDLRTGIELLRARQPRQATQALVRAVARNPDRSHLHYLLGLAHHLDFLQGNQSAGELAEAAYGAALQLDAAHVPAMLQIAHLMHELRQHDRAQAAYARVLDAEVDHAEAAYGLARASYYVRDLETAVAAIERTRSLRPDSADIRLAAAMIHAAAGNTSRAQRLRLELGDGSVTQEKLARLDRRLTQWQSLHEGGSLGSPAAGSVELTAQSLPLGQGGRMTSDSRTNGAPAGSNEPLVSNWMDCTAMPTQGWQSSAASGGMSTTNPGDETAQLPALPSPCRNRPLPRMVVIDAAIVRSEETSSSSAGFNLMQGLQLVFGYSNVVSNITNPDRSVVRTVTQNRSVGFPQAGITYALNIANAVDLRADVLSRPTLVALDRQPSTFFSGTNLTIAIPGQISGGNIVEKPIGLSLSVTPTILDNDNVMLAIKAARTDVEQGTPGSFDQALHTTRNLVTASVLLRFDQTLILGGYTLHESTVSKSGVPGLRDVPVAQYLFSNANATSFRKSVMFSLTPRRPVVAGVDVPQPVDPVLQDLKERLGRDFKMPPNLQSTLRSLASNRFVAQFRAGDLSEDGWHNSLERQLKPILRWLHY